MLLQPHMASVNKKEVIEVLVAYLARLAIYRMLSLTLNYPVILFKPVNFLLRAH